MIMDLEIPDDLVESFPTEVNARRRRVLLELACGMYAAHKLTLAQGARLAGLTRMEFDAELGDRDIPMHYGAEEWKEDFTDGSRK